MFIAPETLLTCWGGFSFSGDARQDALSRLAARDCIESVLQLRHPSVDRFAEAVHAVDERQRRHLPEARSMSSRWWWAAAPPPPVEAPDLGSVAASATAAEIWRQAIAVGLSPFDRMTFSTGGGDVVGRLRFQAVPVQPVVFRPWIDFVLVPAERAYYQVMGAEPPEIFTATVSALAGRLRNTGVHLPGHAGPGAVKDAIARHLESFMEIVSRATPEYLMDDLLRQQRLSGGTHFEWRLPLALAEYGRGDDARQALAALTASAARRPYGRACHELQWLSRRLRI